MEALTTPARAKLLKGLKAEPQTPVSFSTTAGLNITSTTLTVLGEVLKEQISTSRTNLDELPKLNDSEAYDSMGPLRLSKTKQQRHLRRERMSSPWAEGLNQHRNMRRPLITRGIRFGGLEMVPFDPNLDPPRRNCYNCWRFGHDFKFCAIPQFDLFCYNCGRRDEKITTCPRCSEAYYYGPPTYDSDSSDVSMPLAPNRRKSTDTFRVRDTLRLLDALRDVSPVTRDRILKIVFPAEGATYSKLF